MMKYNCNRCGPQVWLFLLTIISWTILTFTLSKLRNASLFVSFRLCWACSSRCALSTVWLKIVPLSMHIITLAIWTRRSKRQGDAQEDRCARPHTSVNKYVALYDAWYQEPREWERTKVCYVMIVARRSVFSGRWWRFASLGPETIYDYDLFAVINHDGQIDTGHYTNYARSQDQVWPYLYSRSTPHFWSIRPLVVPVWRW